MSATQQTALGSHTLALILLLAFLTVIALDLVWWVFMSFRNEWVHKERVRLIHTDPSAFARLPSYKKMLNRFWIWDVRRFL